MMKCIHKIAINFHCPYCWELMKKLYRNPDNKKIVRITDYKKLKTSKVNNMKKKSDKKIGMFECSTCGHKFDFEKHTKTEVITVELPKKKKSDKVDDAK